MADSGCVGARERSSDPYKGKRACRGGNASRLRLRSPFMPRYGGVPRPARAHDETAGERGARPAASAGGPHGGGGGRPEGCGARTGGHGPVSTCVYNGAAAATHRGALERGMWWRARRRTF
jgi:hypothetical protein